jgi:hypothetical protein
MSQRVSAARLSAWFAVSTRSLADKGQALFLAVEHHLKWSTDATESRVGVLAGEQIFV